MNKKSISLVALIVTIIVLIILTGTVVINMMEDNSILNKGYDATSKYHHQSEVEMITSDLLAYELLKVEGTQMTLVEYMQQKVWCGHAVYEEEDNKVTVTVNDCGHMFEILPAGKVVAVEGIKNNTVTVTSMDEIEYFMQNKVVQTIVLEADIEIDKQIEVKNRTMKIIGGGHTITYDDTYNGIMFSISSDASLIIEDVNINGGNQWNWDNDQLQLVITNTKANSSIYIDGELPDIAVSQDNGKVISGPIFLCSGDLKIDGNTTITNCYLDDVNNNIIRAIGDENKIPTITLGDVEIYHCVGSTGSISYGSNAKYVLNKNLKIYDNYIFGGNGGLFNLENNTNLNFESGQIYDNVLIAQRGNIFYANGSTAIVMNGGTISNNTGLRGGSSTTGSMIECVHLGTCVINGGSIINNSGVLTGAIGVRWPDSEELIYVTLNGGTIKDNIVHIPDTWYHPDAIFSRGKVVISENMVVNGNVNINDAKGNLINNGKIEGDVFVTHANVSITNNGIIDGDVTVTVQGGTFINNGTVSGIITQP